MTYLDDESRYFRAALLSEMTARGRGIQAELSRLTGITPSIICDLKFGRTGTSLKNRQALAKGLGYGYEDFIAKGREMSGKKRKGAAVAKSPAMKGRDEYINQTIRSLNRMLESCRRRVVVLSQKLIASQEKHIAANDEILRLHREMDSLRWSKLDS